MQGDAYTRACGPASCYRENEAPFVASPQHYPSPSHRQGSAPLYDYGAVKSPRSAAGCGTCRRTRACHERAAVLHADIFTIMDHPRCSQSCRSAEAEKTGCYLPVTEINIPVGCIIPKRLLIHLYAAPVPAMMMMHTKSWILVPLSVLVTHIGYFLLLVIVYSS